MLIKLILITVVSPVELLDDRAGELVDLAVLHIVLDLLEGVRARAGLEDKAGVVGALVVLGAGGGQNPVGEHEGLLDGSQAVKFGDELEDLGSAFGELVGEDHLDLVVLVEVHVDGAGEVEGFVDELFVLGVGAA